MVRSFCFCSGLSSYFCALLKSHLRAPYMQKPHVWHANTHKHKHIRQSVWHKWSKKPMTQTAPHDTPKKKIIPNNANHLELLQCILLFIFITLRITGVCTNSTNTGCCCCCCWAGVFPAIFLCMIRCARHDRCFCAIHIQRSLTRIFSCVGDSVCKTHRICMHIVSSCKRCLPYITDSTNSTKCGATILLRMGNFYTQFHAPSIEIFLLNSLAPRESSRIKMNSKHLYESAHSIISIFPLNACFV